MGQAEAAHEVVREHRRIQWCEVDTVTQDALVSVRAGESHGEVLVNVQQARAPKKHQGEGLEREFKGEEFEERPAEFSPLSQAFKGQHHGPFNGERTERPYEDSEDLVLMVFGVVVRPCTWPQKVEQIVEVVVVRQTELLALDPKKPSHPECIQPGGHQIVFKDLTKTWATSCNRLKRS